MTKPAEWAPLRDAILAHLNPAKWAVALDQAKGCRNAEACRIYLTDLDLEDDLRATHGAIQKLRDKG